jgi:hypothetical protein
MAGTPNQWAGKVTTLFKKAKLITEAEARYIISHTINSSGEWVVIQYMDQWFDLRGLKEAEIADLLHDLDRKRTAELAAGIANPH